MGKIAEIMGKVLGSSASTIVDSVGRVIDDLNLSAEEKLQLNQKITEELNRHTEAIERLSVERLQAELGDTSNARNTNAQIQESDKASWIAKNLPYILGGIMVIAFFV